MSVMARIIGWGQVGWESKARRMNRTGVLAQPKLQGIVRVGRWVDGNRRDPVESRRRKRVGAVLSVTGSEVTFLLQSLVAVVQTG